MDKADRVMYRKLALIRANEEVGPANCNVLLWYSGRREGASCFSKGHVTNREVGKLR